MTWYASEILLRPTQAARHFLASDPRFAPLSYLIPAALVDRSASSDAPGLLIVQPIGDPEDHCADWFGEPFLSWSDLRAEGDVPASAVLCRNHPEAEADWFPPAAFLAWLKALAHRLGTDLVFYFYFSWGGVTELEYAWFFGSREEGHLLISEGGRDEVDVVTTNGVLRRSHEGILKTAVNYVGGNLAGFDFKPHYRGFPWSDHLLGTTR